MANKEPLFEGTVNDLLTGWFSTEVGKHWMDKGNKRIVIRPALRAWEKLNANGNESNANGNESNANGNESNTNGHNESNKSNEKVSN